jgi:cellulose synthase (UDP-forming)
VTTLPPLPLPDILIFLLAAAALGLSLAWPAAPRARQVCYLISTLLSARYLLWRGLATLSSETLWSAAVSYALLGAEIYGVSRLISFYIQTWVDSPVRRAPALPTPTPAVDVFITIYDEPVEILFRTAVSCLAMDYPRKTVYVLDDGGREEVRALAHRLGCVYLARGDRVHAKAGNLNHALRHSCGDLVAVFDVDHAPVRSFLRETVGFFSDPRVAFVQTPHTFYNPDPFQRNLLLPQHVVNEQDLFYRLVMPGKDRWNAAFFCGSAAVFRRSALEAIGGFRTDTVTEDFHTSLHLHARGYRSIYLNRPLSRGLAPEDFSHYISQRLRWARGALQALRLDNPLAVRGLTLPQRLLYLDSIVHFFFPIPRLIYTLAPLAFLLGGVKPMVADLPALANYFLTHYLVSVVVFDTFSRGLRGSLISTVYELALSFFQMPVLVQTLLSPRRGTFKVTPKGLTRQRRTFHAALAAPPLATGLLLAVGAGAGIARMVQAGGVQPFVMVNILWALYHLSACGWATAVAWERPQNRSAHRVKVSLPVRLEGDWETWQKRPVVTSAGQVLHHRRVATREVRCYGRTLDVSEAGASVLVAPRALPPVVTVSLGANGSVVKLLGQVVACELVARDAMRVLLRFVGTTEEERSWLIAAVFGTPDGLDGEEGRPLGVGADALIFVTGPLRSLIPERARRRRAPRIPVGWRGEVLAAGRSVPVQVKDISVGGARIVTFQAFPAGIQDVTLDFMSPRGSRFRVPASVKRVRRGVFTTTVACEFGPMDARERARLGEDLHTH